MPRGVYPRARRKGPVQQPTAVPVSPTTPPPPVPWPNIVRTASASVVVTHQPQAPDSARSWTCPECDQSFRRLPDGRWTPA